MREIKQTYYQIKLKLLMETPEFTMIYCTEFNISLFLGLRSLKLLQSKTICM